MIKFEVCTDYPGIDSVCITAVLEDPGMTRRLVMPIEDAEEMHGSLGGAIEEAKAKVESASRDLVWRRHLEGSARAIARVFADWGIAGLRTRSDLKSSACDAACDAIYSGCKPCTFTREVAEEIWIKAYDEAIG